MKRPLGNGVRVGAYYIVSVLSEHGGFSFTYLAEGPDGRRVALKELYLSDICEREESGTVRVKESKRGEFDEVLKAFAREGRKLSELGVMHRHIVNVFDVFEANGTCYLVMEYISGRQLHDWTDREEGRPELRKVKRVMTALCDALQYLHQKHSLFHFDLKSSNVMIEDGVERPVLIDFGTSRHYDSDNRQTRGVWQSAYTPGYMAPEFSNGQVDGSKLEDAARIDVFGLGATLFRVLTQQHPPVVVSDGEVARRLEATGLPAEYGPYVEAAKAAMRFEPAQRLQSVAELGRMLGFELEHQVEGDVVKTLRRSVVAEKPTELQEGLGAKAQEADPEATRRRPEGATQGAAEVPTEKAKPIEKPTVEPWKPRHTEKPRPEASRQGKEGSRVKWVVAVLTAAVVVLAGMAVWLGLSSSRRSEVAVVQYAPELYDKGDNETPMLHDKSADADNAMAEHQTLPAVEEGVEEAKGGAVPSAEQEAGVASASQDGMYEFPQGGNIWYGPLYAGEPDGVGELSIFSRTTIGDSVLQAGWTVRNAVFEEGLFISGDVYDAENKYLYTYIP